MAKKQMTEKQMTEKQFKRMAGYVRVSTEDQVETKSLEAQRRALRDYAATHGLEIVEIYADEGASAYHDDRTKRPEFRRLLADAEGGRFDVVVVHTIDRWARNQLVHLESLAQLHRSGVGFLSIVESWDFDSAHGRMMLAMIAAFAEMTSTQIGIHVAKSQQERALQGLHVGPVPFGYAATDGQAAVLVEPAASAVKEIFTRRAAGESLSEIASWLNEAGHRTQKGNRFTEHAVKDILACRFYRGVISYLGEEYAAQHEALIEDSLWNAVARLKQRRPRAPRRPNLPLGVFQGRVKCHRCLRPLQSERSPAGYPLYRERHNGDCSNNKHAMRTRWVDDPAAALLMGLELPADLRGIVLSAASQPEEADKRRAALLERKRRLGNGYVHGAVDEKAFHSEVKRIDDELRDLEPTTALSVERIDALCRDLNLLWDEATPDERKELMAPLIDEVYVDVQEKRAVAIRPNDDLRYLVEALFTAEEREGRVVSTARLADGRELELVGMVETGENTPPVVPHSLWLPYPLEPAWDAHRIGWWTQAA